MLQDDDVRTTELMLIRMVECTIATVEMLAERTRPPRGELDRQVLIADEGLRHLRDRGIRMPDPQKHEKRAPDVERLIANGRTVRQYADALLEDEKQARARIAQRDEGPAL